jgi:phage terminase large subunit-like protein
MTNLSKQKQVAEIIKCGKDPTYFFNTYLKIQHPVKGLIPFNTYPFQDDCVQDFIDNRFNIVLKSRQLGLSTLVSAYSVWMAIFQREKNILIIATKLAVAQNFISKVKTMIKSLPKWLMRKEMG